MNEEIQIKIIDLMDDGATLECSLELRQLVESSEEAQSFYESILVSESAIKSFFGGEKAKELSNKIDAFIDKQFDESSKVQSIKFKPIKGADHFYENYSAEFSNIVDNYIKDSLKS